MKNVHIVIPDLFLPQEVAADACAGLELSVLEKLLARARSQPLAVNTLEAWLCEAFAVADQAIAPVTLGVDGMEAGEAYWLRADPVHLRLQRDQLILQAQVELSADEAMQLCASLNAHFADRGLRFFAPHPQRWYLQLGSAPDMSTRPVAQVAGRNVHMHLPQGAGALRWHGVFNEIQMLFFEHGVNEAREARGEPPINSVWLWGGGRAAGTLAQPYTKVCSDSQLASAFAQAAGVAHVVLADDVTPCVAGSDADVLIVWEGLCHALQQGDLHAWRVSLQRFEQHYAAPLLAALRAGRISQLTLDVPVTTAARRFVLTHRDAWKLWRRPGRLAHHSMV